MYPECVFVALVIQPEKLMHHIVICGLPGCTIFLDIISKMAGFSKKNVIKHEMCFFILLSYWHLGLQVKYLLFVSDFSQT